MNEILIFYLILWKKINTLTPVISRITALAGYAEIWDSIVGKMPRSFTDLNVILFYT